MSLVTFLIIAGLILVAAVAAALMQKLIHAAFCLVGAFLAVAAFFFLLNAEFVGLVQVFVYVGAVAVLIVFTILLTQREDEQPVGFNWSGALIAIAVCAGLVWAIIKTPTVLVTAPAFEPLTVKRIGEVLMTDYIWPLLCVGLLLTAALIGGLIWVNEDRDQD